RDAIDGCVEFARIATIRTESQFRQADHAHAKIGRPVLDHSFVHLPLTTKRETDAVGIEHEPAVHLNGSFSVEMSSGSGRSISSVTLPKTARNSGVHSSSGSRITFFPTRRTDTSRCPSGNRNAFGS